jgi:hypothetical protein
VNAEPKTGFSHDRALQPDIELDPDQASPAVLAAIKTALVTSRLSLTGNDGGRDPYGRDPYDNRRGQGPGSVWRGRTR